MNDLYDVTCWQSLTNTKGTPRVYTFAALLEVLRERARRIHDGSGWSPAAFECCYRDLAHHVSSGFLGLDFDHGANRSTDKLAHLFGRYRAIVHSTKSSKPNDPRARVLLALSRPVDSEEYARAIGYFVRLAESRGMIVDSKARDASRLWFWPTLTPYGPSTIVPINGQPVDVDKVLAESPAEPEVKRDYVPTVNVPQTDVVRRAMAYVDRMPPAISGSGGHAATWAVAVAVVCGFGLDDDAALSVLETFNLRCEPPWSRAELVHKVKSAGASRKVGRGYLLEGRAA